MAGRLRLNTNVTQHEYDAVTPTQNKPAQMQYALLDAINLVPRTEDRPQIAAAAAGFYYHSNGHHQQQHQQQQYIPQPSPSTMFESLPAATAPSAMSAPNLAAVTYPLVAQQRHHFAGERDASVYSAYSASDMDTASGTPDSSSDWSPASFTYPAANGFSYNNIAQEQAANSAAAYGHLYSSIYNPGYVNCHNPYAAFGQAPVMSPVQHVLPQGDVQQQQRIPPPVAPPELSNLAFADMGASLPPAAMSRPSSPDTNALYYSSGEESTRTSLSRASSIASIASSTGSRTSSLKYRTSSKSADGVDKKEKKFTCTYPGCDRSFSRNFNLSTHYNTHLGIKPFACTHCDKTFSRRHDCARHIAAVHTPSCPKNSDSKDCTCGQEHHSPSEATSSAPFVNPPSLAFAQMSPFMANHSVMPQVYDGM